MEVLEQLSQLPIHVMFAIIQFSEPLMVKVFMEESPITSLPDSGAYEEPESHRSGLLDACVTVEPLLKDTPELRPSILACALTD